MLFWVTEITYLVIFYLQKVYIRPDSDKILAIKACPTPTTVKQVRSQVRAFLGLSEYYRRFISRYAQVATPITDLLKKTGFRWSQEAEMAFEVLKTALTTAPVLVYSNFELPFIRSRNRRMRGRSGSRPATRGASNSLLQQEAIDASTTSIHLC